jgi:putative transposase
MREKTKVVIELTPEEEQALKIWAAARAGEQRLVQRAKVILYSAEGLGLEEIGRRSGLSPQNASKWRKRFMVNRMDGLRDLDRPGRPPSISPERKVKVIALV